MPNNCPPGYPTCTPLYTQEIRDAERKAREDALKWERDLLNTPVSLSSTPSGTVTTLRNYYDEMAKKVGPGGRRLIGGGVDSAALLHSFPHLKKYNAFWHLAWKLVLPGQTGVGLHPLLVRVNFGDRTWGSTSHVFTPPPRMNAQSVGHRLLLLSNFAKKFNALDLQKWPTYNNAIAEWILDPGVGDNVLGSRLSNLSLLLKAWESVPWPSRFFRGFLASPRVSLPPFAEGMLYNDARLAASPYFPKTQKEIEKNIANYLYDNQEGFIDHFVIVSEEYIQEQQEKLAAKQKAQERLGKVLEVFSLLMSALPGPGWLTTILFDIPKTAFEVYSVRKFGKEQLKTQEKVMEVLGFAPHDMETLNQWITANAVVKPYVPPAPSGGGTYTLWINASFIGKDEEMSSLIAYATHVTKVGDTVEIGENDEVIGVFLRRKEELELIPEEAAAKMQLLTHSQTKEIANNLDGTKDIPWWLVALPVAGVIILN